MPIWVHPCYLVQLGQFAAPRVGSRLAAGLQPPTFAQVALERAEEGPIHEQADGDDDKHHRNADHRA